MIVCDRRYNSHQFWTALDTLKKRGHTFDVISTDYIIQDEITLEASRIEQTINDIDHFDHYKYDAFMLISGNPEDTKAYWDNSIVHTYIREANELAKPIAAICMSVPTIRNIAKGKRVSFFPLLRSIELLKNAGAILTTVSLSRDQNLVTAEHEIASQVWANEFCNLLEGKPPEYNLQESGFAPKGRERKPIPAVENIRYNQRREDT